jgi:murein DD-endopeptidase MepM/ murein hydrolase activator NlpD
MNNHFTITFTDDNGVKQFNLHHFVKKAVFYSVVFLGFVGFIAVGTILYLNKSVNEAENERLQIEQANANLKLKNENLSQNIQNTNSALIAKKKELNEVSDSLSEIEMLIGLAPVADMSLQERVGATKLNSEHMATLLQFIPNGSPITYKGITSKYGYRIHPTLRRREFHRGLDMKAKMKTPVYATADGIVEYSGLHKKSGFGNLVILQHNYGFRTYFGHLNKVAVKAGRFVKKGDIIAYTGSSGMSSGPHLHYEIRFIQRAVNPFYFVKWNIQNYKNIFEKEKNIPWQSLITATAHIRVPNPTQTLLSLRQVPLSKER